MTITLTGVDGASRQLTDEAVEALRAGLRGSLLDRPLDPEQEPRPAWNPMHDGRAALTARCSGTADVVDAVRFAREHGLLVAVRGGGHSVSGLSTVSDGLLIDLSAMNGVQVDPLRRLAHVQGGALWGDVDRETQVIGLATPGGVVSDTGVAGLTLGGGYGWLRRRYGLSSDNLVEAQVVCADGTVRTASADSEPDLFWALRGGGGNFGVVTSFTFRLHPVGPIVAFAAPFYPLEDLRQILEGWRDYTATAPDDVTSVVLTITFPAVPGMPEVIHDRRVAIVGGVYAGDPDRGAEVLAPLRELATPLFDMSGPTPFTAVQSGFDAFFPRQTLRSYWKSQYLDSLSDEAIAAIDAAAQDRPAPITLVNTFHMGGALSAVDPESTAFAQRQPPYMVSIDGMWTDPDQDRSIVSWVRSRWDEVRKHGTGAVYLNFTGLDDEPVRAGTDTAFGRNLLRLGQVKAQYDPTNLFQVNNNVTPAS
ncbi:FAD-binding oxidoreductase [Pseudonocardia bannensis]|uniref:FAD-binding oxidoreductase n=1 Tax=Pseudonocardia bannensis TaxID=630973 RepID=A0A848DGJ3_9PSEU|nr:FAD-binding oxidoreductase [Pseudonocardia bannensis]NMH91790.1 FAD-binding oxidoreductase [Pseudonocardia bannensis]